MPAVVAAPADPVLTLERFTVPAVRVIALTAATDRRVGNTDVLTDLQARVAGLVGGAAAPSPVVVPVVVLVMAPPTPTRGRGDQWTLALAARGLCLEDRCEQSQPGQGRGRQTTQNVAPIKLFHDSCPPVLSRAVRKRGASVIMHEECRDRRSSSCSTPR
jgi:hypothetical protein